MRRDGGSPFIGREPEIEQLRVGLDDIGAGRGRLFMIVGEPGIGKTRLVNELAAEAEQRSLRVFWGRCWESGGAPAYWPWVQIIRSYVHSTDAAAVAVQLGAASDLLHIVPELGARVPGAVEVETSDPEQGRFRALDAAASFLRSAAVAGPLVLLLEDLHAADQSSLLLLRFVARELRAVPVLIAGTYRETDAARDPVVASILAEVAREGQRIPLRGLSSAAVASYIAAVAPRHVDRSFVDAVFAVTEGNPLFLGEVVRLWIAEQQRHPGADRATALSIPEEVRVALRQRFTPLTVAARRVLGVAAVLGREFDAVLVRRVLARADGEPAAPAALVLECLDAGRSAGVIQSMPGARGRFAFAHVLLREVLYDDLRSAERAELHRHAGSTLEQMHATNLGPHLAAIAHHYAQAALDGDIDKAIEFARRAGDRALSMLGYEDAVRYFDNALQALVERRGGALEADVATQCELLLSLADALWSAGDIRRMRETFQLAAEVARGMPREQGGPRLARAALGFGGQQQRAHVVFDIEVVRLLEEACAALDESDSPLRARVLARLAYALYAQPGSFERRKRLCRQAVEMARRIGDPTTLRRVLNDWRWALWSPDTIEERLEIAAELVRLAENAGESEMAFGERMWRMVDLLELGEIGAFEAELEIYTRLAREQPRPWFEWYARRFRAMRALLQGRFAEAERLSEEAMAALKRTQQQDAILIYSTSVLAIRSEQGRLAELEAGIQALLAQYPAVGIWRYIVAFLHAELERPAETKADLERIAARDLADLPGDYLRLAAGAYLSEACAFVGDARRSALLYEILRPYAARCVVLGFGVACLGSLSRHLGMLAGTMGLRDTAAEHFETALEVNARLGARPAVARTQWAYARMLLAPRSDGESTSAASNERAAQLLREARATAIELGMQSVATSIAKLAARAGIGLDRAPHGDEHRPLPGAVADTIGCRYLKEGEYWSIGFPDRVFRLKHVRGLAYLDHLLRRPGEEIHVFDLLDLAGGVAMEGGKVLMHGDDDPGPTIDATARAAYKQRLRDLREDLLEAESLNDVGRAEQCRAEIDMLAEQLAAASGLGGRDRGRALQANRARVAVAKAIRVALGKIEEQNPELAQHLELTIRTGTFCSYKPDLLHPLVWRFD